MPSAVQQASAFPELILWFWPPRPLVPGVLDLLLKSPLETRDTIRSDTIRVPFVKREYAAAADAALVQLQHAITAAGGDPSTSNASDILAALAANPDALQSAGPLLVLSGLLRVANVVSAAEMWCGTKNVKGLAQTCRRAAGAFQLAAQLPGAPAVVQPLVLLSMAMAHQLVIAQAILGEKSAALVARLALGLCDRLDAVAGAASRATSPALAAAPTCLQPLWQLIADGLPHVRQHAANLRHAMRAVAFRFLVVHAVNTDTGHSTAPELYAKLLRRELDTAVRACGGSADRSASSATAARTDGVLLARLLADEISLADNLAAELEERARSVTYAALPAAAPIAPPSDMPKPLAGDQLVTPLPVLPVAAYTSSKPSIPAASAGTAAVGAAAPGPEVGAGAGAGASAGAGSVAGNAAAVDGGPGDTSASAAGGSGAPSTAGGGPAGATPATGVPFHGAVTPSTGTLFLPAPAASTGTASVPPADTTARPPAVAPTLPLPEPAAPALPPSVSAHVAAPTEPTAAGSGAAAAAMLSPSRADDGDTPASGVVLPQLPPTPSAPVAESVDADTITLHWSLPSAAAPPPGMVFHLQWRRSGKLVWNPVSDTPSQLSYRKQLLSPGTSYEFRVRAAQRGMGDTVLGDFSLPSAPITTLAAVPSAPVGLDAAWVAATPPKLVIQWNLPLDASPPTGCLVFVAFSSGADVRQVLPDGSLSSTSGLVTPTASGPAVLDVPSVGPKGRCELVVCDPMLADVRHGQVRVALRNAEGVGAMATHHWAAAAAVHDMDSSAELADLLARLKAAESVSGSSFVGAIDPSELMYDTPRKSLGSGGFGSVFRTAVGGFRGTTAAVKELHTAAGTEAQLVAMLKEISTLAPLRHPNLVQVYAYSLGHTPLFVMEYASGGSLWDAMYRSKVAQGWSLLQRVVLAVQVADALNYLHTRTPPVIHRDLKPQNVVLMEATPAHPEELDALHVTPRLCDFGLARLRESSAVATSFGGSFPFLAPEAFRSDVAITEAVDVFSFAVLVNELMACQPPWKGLDQFQITMAVAVQGRRPALATFDDMPLCHNPSRPSDVATRARIVAAVTQLVTDCWRQEAAERPTFADVCDRLRACVKQLVAPAAP